MKIVELCRVRVKLELSEEFEVKVGVHQGSALSRLLFACDYGKCEKWFDE